MALVRKNPSSSGEFARLWAQLPSAQQRAMIQQVRSALHEVRAAGTSAVQPVHPPYSGQHAHSHPAYGSQGGDASHSHMHSHDGDANHNHGHEDHDAAVQSAEEAKRQRQGAAAVRPRIMNTARRMSPAQEQRIDDAWARLASGAGKGI